MYNTQQGRSSADVIALFAHLRPSLKIILTWAINNTSPEEEAHGQDGTDVEIRS